MLTNEKKNELLNFAADIRTGCIRTIASVGVGHVGGSLSICDLLACLYGGQMQIDPSNPRWDGRDRFVLSKGHAGPAMYAALAYKGYFPMEELDTLNQPPTNLPSHTDRKRTKGVDMTTGSLGQGISTAAGMALALKLQGKKNYTFAVLGDGECEEGQVWEAAAFAAKRNLSRLIAFVDYNGKQIDGTTEFVGGPVNFAEKFRAFGWAVLECPDGNDVEQIWNAIDEAKKNAEGSVPTAVILHTVKGKGWSYAETLDNNHNFKVNQEQYEQAAAEFAAQKV